MARANDNNALSFGFAAAAIFRANQIIGHAEIVGSFTAEVAPELVKTEGGASAYPVAARLARASGEASINFRERPDFFDTELLGGTATSTAAATDPSAGSLTGIVGTSVNGVSVTLNNAQATSYMDFELEATGTSALRVRVAGSNGAQTFENVAISATATSIGQTGVSLTLASPAFTTGDRAAFAVTPAHGGMEVIAVPQVQTGDEYEVRLYTARGGHSDAAYVYTFPRVVFRGPNLMATDVEAPGDIELACQLLAPTDGSSIYTIRKISHA